MILAEWIASVLKPGQSMYVDVNLEQFKPVNYVFQSLRPDIVIVDRDTISTLELTICHESNLENSKQYKTDKYASIHENVTEDYMYHKIKSYTIEVTTLGLISDISKFCRNHLKECMTEAIEQKILNSVVSNSFKIYCERNNNTMSTNK